MNFQDDELEEILNIFRQESSELLQSMDNCLLALQKNTTDKESLLILSRNAHSVKGAVRMLGYEKIQDLVHKFEDVIIAMKEGRISIKKENVEILVKALNYIAHLIDKTIENKGEYTDEEFDGYVNTIENITAKNASPVLSETFMYHLKSSFALIAEIDLFWFKFQKTKDEEYLNEIKSKFEDLKTLFESINFNEGTRKVSEIVQDFEQNKKNLNKETLNIQNILNDFCKKNNIDTIDSQKIAKDRFSEMAKRKKETKEKVQIRQISANIDNDYVNLIKTLIDRFSKNVRTYQDILNIITEILSKTSNPDLKRVFDILTKILKHSMYLGQIKDETHGAISRIFVDILEMFEDSKTSDADWETLLQRVQTIEQLESADTVSEFKKETTAVSKPIISNDAKSYSGQDWFDNMEASSIKTLRVDSTKLDKLVNQTSELILTKIKIGEELSMMKKFQIELDEFHKNWHKMGDYVKYYDRKYLLRTSTLDIQSVVSYNKQLINFYAVYSENLSTMMDKLSILQKQMQDNDAKLSSNANEIENMAKDLRILPLATIFHLFPRMVHNISQEVGKEIDFTIEGSDVSADKKIIEEIKLPLMHILRNSIDHGIETPDTRISKGKKPYGTISIKAKHQGNKIIINVKDDGKGIDLEKIKQTAISKGIVGYEEIKKYTDEQILDLIFSLGFSTQENVTDISGRGIGLDIVKNKISQLNGKINVYSKIDEGTMITIELPVAMATTNAFIVVEKEQYFAIDTFSIQAVVQVDSEEIFTKDKRNYFIYQERAIPIFSLSQVLNFENEKISKKSTVMLVRENNQTVGIIVSQLVNDQEILMRKLSKPLLHVRHISGITTLANGDSCLILNIDEIINTVMNESATLKIAQLEKPQTIENKKFNIIVVDDSFTTRTLQKSILQNDGYNVEVYENSKEALEMLRGNKYDLLITDYDMPDITGLDIVRAIRTPQEKNYTTPVIVLSSFNEQGLKNEFVKYNIERFIQKNEFNQTSFLRYVQFALTKNKHKGTVNES